MDILVDIACKYIEEVLYFSCKVFLRIETMYYPPSSIYIHTA